MESDESDENYENDSNQKILDAIDKLYERLPENEKLVCLYAFYQDLKEESQCDYFELLGSLFSKQLYDQTTQSIFNTKESNFDDLSYVSKKSFFETADPRLKSFFTSITKKKIEGKKENVIII